MIKAFELIWSAVKVAEDEYNINKSYDADEVNWLHKKCDAIDSIVSEFNGSLLDVNINEDTHDITISLVCDMYSPNGVNDVRLQTLMMTSYKTTFSYESDELIRISILSPSVWRENDEQ